MNFLAKDYQSAIIKFIQANQRCGVWAGMGTGKSASTATALDELSLIEDVYPVLIIAPLRVAQSTWPDEYKKWDHLAGVTVSAIVGSASERKLALAKKADVYTINYENIPWLREQLGDAWPFKTIVADEATKLKGFRTRQGTARAKALAQVAHVSSRFIELTGTPAANGLKDT